MSRLSRIATIALVFAVFAGLVSPLSAAAAKERGVVTVTEPKAKNQFYDEARAITIDAKGRAVVAARLGFSTIGIYRFTATGKLDKKFGKNGKVKYKTRDEPTDVTTDSKGRVTVVAVRNPNSITSTTRVVRFTAKGKLDKKFAKKGVVTRKSFRAHSVTVDKAGRYLVTGQHYPAKGRNFGEIFRLNAKGKPDKSFGSAGRTRLAKYGAEETGYLGTSFREAKLDSSGRIYVHLAVFKGMLTDMEFGVARLNANGSFDPSYGTWGEGYTLSTRQAGAESGSMSSRSMTLHSDGRITFAGAAEHSPGYAVANFDSEGNLSQAIKIVKLSKNFLDQPSSVLAVAGGKTVIVGDLYRKNAFRIGVIRTHSSGARDASFGTKGITQLKVRSHPNVKTAAAAVDRKGRIYVLATAEGKKYGTSASKVTVVRLKASGKVDRSWGK